MTRYTCLEDVDLDRLKTLLSDAFGKPLPDSYFDSVRDKLRAIYLFESYRGAAIFTTEHGTYACLNPRVQPHAHAITDKAPEADCI